MLKKIGKAVAAAVLMVGLSVSGYYAGNKSASRAFVIDPNDGKAISIATDKDVTIYVIGPQGIELGIGYARSKDGSKIIVVPPEALESGPDSLAPSAPAPEQQHSSPLEPHLPPVART